METSSKNSSHVFLRFLFRRRCWSCRRRSDRHRIDIHIVEFEILRGESRCGCRNGLGKGTNLFFKTENPDGESSSYDK